MSVSSIYEHTNTKEWENGKHTTTTGAQKKGKFVVHCGTICDHRPSKLPSIMHFILCCGNRTVYFVYTCIVITVRNKIKKHKNINRKYMPITRKNNSPDTKICFHVWYINICRTTLYDFLLILALFYFFVSRFFFWRLFLCYMQS